MIAVRFYHPQKPYGCFSNFYRCPVEVDGRRWPTTEHFYQAMKFEDSALQEQIRLMEKPRQAADFARDPKNPLRKDWESIKYGVMVKALYAKFTQYESFRQLLIDTGDAQIIEDSPTDYVWGCGKDGTGQNLLGKALMEVRGIISKPGCSEPSETKNDDISALGI